MQRLVHVLHRQAFGRRRREEDDADDDDDDEDVDDDEYGDEDGSPEFRGGASRKTVHVEILHQKTEGEALRGDEGHICEEGGRGNAKLSEKVRTASFLFLNTLRSAVQRMCDD